jgi:hypothetical protein
MLPAHIQDALRPEQILLNAQSAQSLPLHVMYKDRAFQYNMTLCMQPMFAALVAVAFKQISRSKLDYCECHSDKSRYNYVDVMHLVRFIELWLYAGVQRFFVYVHSCTTDVLRVLQVKVFN